MLSKFAFATALLLAAQGSASAIPLPATHLTWLHTSNAWIADSALVDADSDGSPDVVTALGHRTTPYSMCLVPPGNPALLAHRLLDPSLTKAAALEALDGATGESLWHAPLTAPKDSLIMIEQVVGGLLDSDSKADLLILWSIYTNDSIQLIIEMRNPSNGDVVWRQERSTPRDKPTFRRFTPLTVDGLPGGLLTESSLAIDLVEAGMNIDMLGGGAMVTLPAGLPPSEVIAIPSDMPGPVAHPTETGYRLVSTQIHIEIRGSTFAQQSSLRADDVHLGDTPSVSAVWHRSGTGGNPVVIAGGDSPFVAVGRERSDKPRSGEIFAMSLETGQDLWNRHIDVSPFGGTMQAMNLDGDSQEDLLVAPGFNPEPTGTLTGSPVPQLVALQGNNGSTLWSKLEPAGKIRAWALAAGPVDSDGTGAVYATYAHQDGAATCAQSADDPGLVAAYDRLTGKGLCRFSTDRLAPKMLIDDLDGQPGAELAAATLGGNVYAFRHAAPGCGPVHDQLTLNSIP